MVSLTIGQLARRAGVGVETVRFYEREGLISEPPRRPSGYRDYPLEAVSRIVFIRRAKKLGFSLKEISELLGLRVRPRRNCAQVKQNADAKIDDIDAKIGGCCDSLQPPHPVHEAVPGTGNSSWNRRSTGEGFGERSWAAA